MITTALPGNRRQERDGKRADAHYSMGRPSPGQPKLDVLLVYLRGNTCGQSYIYNIAGRG